MTLRQEHISWGGADGWQFGRVWAGTEHESMMSGWHKKGAHYPKACKHSDIIFLFLSLCQTPLFITVNCWPEGKYRPAGHNIGEHHEWPRKHIL